MGAGISWLHEALTAQQKEHLPQVTRDGHRKPKTLNMGSEGPDEQGTRRASVGLLLTRGPQTTPPSQGRPGDSKRLVSPSPGDTLPAFLEVSECLSTGFPVWRSRVLLAAVMAGATLS